MSSCAGWKREAAALLLIGIGEWRVTLPINDDDPQREDRERGAGERYVAGQRLWRAKKKKDCNEYNRLRYTLRNELPSKLVFYSSWLTLHIDHHHGTVTVYNPFLFLMIPDHLRFLMRIGLEATLLNGNAEGTVFEKSLEVSHLIISERAKWAIYFQRKCICPNCNYSHFWRENSTIWKVFAKVKIRIFGIIFFKHCASLLISYSWIIQGGGRVRG